MDRAQHFGFIASKVARAQLNAVTEHDGLFLLNAAIAGAQFASSSHGLTTRVRRGGRGARDR